MDFVRMRAKFPDHIPFVFAKHLMTEFIEDSLHEFKVAPTNEQLQTYVNNRYRDWTCDTSYCVMICLSPEEALNTVSSRSMETYEPVKKRKRKLSKEESKELKTYKKFKCKGGKCEICQYDFKGPRYVLPCGCHFHGKCIRQAIKYSDKCPLCYTTLNFSQEVKSK
eukprot:g14778.t1